MSSPALDDPAGPPAAPAVPESREPGLPEEDLYCPECGYNLHALVGVSRCPECGLQIDREGFARSRVPWIHRRAVGRIRAYWRTVWLATLRPTEIAGEASRRVSYPDAQRFRYVTAFVAAAPVIAGLVAAMVWYGSAALFTLINPSTFPGWAMSGQPSPAFDLLVPWDAGASLPPVVPIAVLVVCVLVTGVASYWFHPRALPVVRQNRAVALSYYACGPLAFVSVPVLALVGVGVMKEAGLGNQADATWAVMRVLQIAAAVSGLLVGGAFWRTTMTLLNRTTRPGPARLFFAGALIPLEWLLCAAFVGAAFPWVVGFVRLVVGSLR